MFMIIKILILAALVKLLTETNNPILCAGIYAFVGLVFSLLWGNPFPATILACIIGFGLATLYFWLLDKFHDNTAVWWSVLILGLLIGLV